MNKSTLRKSYLQKRLALPDTQRSRLDDLMLIRFQQWALPGEVETVMSFWPLREKAEPNTFLLTDFLQFRIPGLQVAYPVTDFHTLQMEAILVEDETAFRLNEYGIGEPADGVQVPPDSIDLVIVPLLAFDLKGYRLGYGKGFYDRFLEQCRRDVIKIGLSYFAPEQVLPGIDQFDVPLTACITPERIYEF